MTGKRATRSVTKRASQASKKPAKKLGVVKKIKKAGASKGKPRKPAASQPSSVSSSGHSSNSIEPSMTNKNKAGVNNWNVSGNIGSVSGNLNRQISSSSTGQALSAPPEKKIPEKPLPEESENRLAPPLSIYQASINTVNLSDPTAPLAGLVGRLLGRPKALTLPSSSSSSVNSVNVIEPRRTKNSLHALANEKPKSGTSISNQPENTNNSSAPSSTPTYASAQAPRVPNSTPTPVNTQNSSTPTEGESNAQDSSAPVEESTICLLCRLPKIRESVKLEKVFKSIASGYNTKNEQAPFIPEDKFEDPLMYEIGHVHSEDEKGDSVEENEEENYGSEESEGDVDFIASEDDFFDSGPEKGSEDEISQLEQEISELDNQIAEKQKIEQQFLRQIRNEIAQKEQVKLQYENLLFALKEEKNEDANSSDQDEESESDTGYIDSKEEAGQRQSNESGSGDEDMA